VIDKHFIQQRILVDDKGCWRWTKRKNKGGYGVTSLGKRRVGAHIISYIAFKGNYDRTLELDHLCRVRDCVNPEHLEPVPKIVNILRGSGCFAKNKQATYCKRGHLLSGDNVYLRPEGRRCRACRARDGQRRRSQKLGQPHQHSENLNGR
jgi:HNH endonuclease